MRIEYIHIYLCLMGRPIDPALGLLTASNNVKQRYRVCDFLAIELVWAVFPNIRAAGVFLRANRACVLL